VTIFQIFQQKKRKKKKKTYQKFYLSREFGASHSDCFKCKKRPLWLNNKILANCELLQRNEKDWKNPVSFLIKKIK